MEKNTAGNSTTVNVNQKVSLREFYDISKWSFKLIFGLEPVYLTLYLISLVLLRTSPLLYTLIYAKAIDALIKTAQTPGSNISQLLPYLGYVALYFIINSLLQASSNFFSNGLTFKTNYKINRTFYTKLHELGIQNLEHPEINNKINRADDYLGSIIPFLKDFIVIIANLIKLTILSFVILNFSPWFILLIGAALIPYFYNDKKFRRLMYKFDFETTEPSRMAGANRGDLTNARDLVEILITKAAGLLDKKYIEFRQWSSDTRLKLVGKWMLSGNSLIFVSNLALLMGYIEVVRKLLGRDISVGTLTLRITYMNNFQDTIVQLLTALNDQFETSIKLKDTYTLFNTKPVFIDGTIELKKLEKGPEIEFRNVSFKYPTSDIYIFKNLNLKINSNEKVAIVGHNGAGKTTLVKLITRLYKATDGFIFVNELDVDDLKVDSFYKNVGALFQEYNRYPQLTVRENIAIGDISHPEDEIAIRLAAQQADALEFIEKLPNKFGQILDERFSGGIRPSTGQWQKLAIARFFYRNAPLVIFDEPTASIDAVSEYNIFNRIYEFFKNKTVIIISHRFSTVRNADRILVMENGAIIEEGTHNHLMAKNGYYAKAFLLQAEGYASS